MESLQKIEALGQAMLEAAGQGDWDRVAALDGERREVLSALAPEGFGEAGPEARRVLEGALELTQSLLRMAREERARHAQALVAVQRGQRGTLKYLSSEG